MSKHVGCQVLCNLHLVLAQEWAVFVLLAAVVLVGKAVVIMVVVMPVVRLVLAVARLVEAKNVIVLAEVILVMAIILHRTYACQSVIRWLVCKGKSAPQCSDTSADQPQSVVACAICLRDGAGICNLNKVCIPM